MLFQDLVDKYEDIYYIDDKAKQIDEVKSEFKKIKAYHLQRPEDDNYNTPSEKANEVIKNLEIDFNPKQSKEE